MPVQNGGGRANTSREVLIIQLLTIIRDTWTGRIPFGSDIG